MRSSPLPKSSKFLDTPVKRYSSGMYVRLAFAVAAHLEPEILIVDEVLAVGDAEFQKKCLGKMDEVARGGRTVLFVSHNMQALRTLSTRALLLIAGKVIANSQVSDVVDVYLESNRRTETSSWSDPEGLGDDDARLKSVSISCGRGKSFSSSDAIFVELVVDVLKAKSGLCIGFDLIADDGTVTFRTYDTDNADQTRSVREPGLYRLLCEIPPRLLHGRRYLIAPRLSIHYQKWIVHCDPLVSANIFLDHGETAYWSSVTAKSRPGLIAPVLKWKSGLLSNRL